MQLWILIHCIVTFLRDITDQSEPTAMKHTNHKKSLFVTHFWINPNWVEMVFTLVTYPLGRSGRYIGQYVTTR
jgi:hypothetical protein